MAKLQVTELDFDDIKDNLKVFLKAQSKFKDYDFEGSGMSVLLDTLAYNTHYLAFNANMAANEMFLDSAALRSSVVSHAKMLGYEVTSSRAPTASLNVFATTNSDTLTMPSGTKFTAAVGSESYSFVTISDITAANSGGTVSFLNTPVYEGTYITSTYNVDTSTQDQRFVLADNRSDISTLTVQVQNSISDTETLSYTKATDITQLIATSAVYFCQEAEAGKFEIYFGDGIVSKALVDGNIVTLKYVVTNKTAANGVSSFTSPSSIDGATAISVQTVGSAIGGAEPESINSIKLKAPLDYASQGRAVTIEDYKIFVKRLFPNTQAVSVWGGEDGSYDTSLGVTDTPEYGKVFISVKSTTGENLTSVQKSNLVSALAPYKVASTTPVIVDAETTNIILNITAQYNKNATTLSPSELQTNILTTITNYNNSTLQVFNEPFRHSRLTSLVDNTDGSILNSTATVRISKSFTPELSIENSYALNFANKIYHPHGGHNRNAGGVITSTGFYLTDNTAFNVGQDISREYFLDDDGDGNIRIYYLSVLDRIYSSDFAGRIDYHSGIVSLFPINILSVSNINGAPSAKIILNAVPDSYDIAPVRNQILELDLVSTNITASVDAITSTGQAFTTTTTATGSTTTVTTASSSAGGSSSSSSAGSSSSSTQSSASSSSSSSSSSSPTRSSGY